MSYFPLGVDAARPESGPVSTRRGLFRMLAILTVIATLCGGFTAFPDSALAASARTTANLNLRSGPATSYAVILVIPDGASVSVDGDPRGGFYPVTYSGRSGYASGDFLTIGGSSDGGSSDAGGPSATGSATVTTSLNLRAGPSTGDRVLAVMPSGSSVTLTGRSSNGFLAVEFRGTRGWAFAQYLSSGGGGESGGDSGSSDAGSPSATGTATVTSSLNLRRGPSTSDGVIAVMPRGATVTLNGRAAEGFLSVTYRGSSGWAFGQYL
nr:SH3 domain-containing protein [Chloroflexia bacterium]